MPENNLHTRLTSKDQSLIRIAARDVSIHLSVSVQPARDLPYAQFQREAEEICRAFELVGKLLNASTTIHIGFPDLYDMAKYKTSRGEE